MVLGRNRLQFKGDKKKNMGNIGHRKKVTGQRRKGRVNMMGGWRYHDKKRINVIIKNGNADVFYEQIKLLNDWLLKEWIAGLRQKMAQKWLKT